MEHTTRQQPPKGSKEDDTKSLQSPLWLCQLKGPEPGTPLTRPEQAKPSPAPSSTETLVNDPFWMVPGIENSSSLPNSRVDTRTAPVMEQSFHHPREEPPTSEPEIMTAALRTLQASFKLQMVLDEQKAEEFKMPPVMPPNLVEMFEQGLAEYGLERQMQNLNVGGKDQNDQVQGGSKAGTNATPGFEPQHRNHSGTSNLQGVGMATPTIIPRTTPLANAGTDPGRLRLRKAQAFTPRSYVSPMGFFAACPPRSRQADPKENDRKRARAPSDVSSNPQQTPHSQQRQPKRPRTTGISGIPVLPASFAHMWNAPKPGLPRLVAIMTRWHSTMKKLFARCNNDALMAMHPLFPYPPMRPVHLVLTSISFWVVDVDGGPRELRFVGPNDMIKMAYVEVDTYEGLGQSRSSATTTASVGATGSGGDNTSKSSEHATAGANGNTQPPWRHQHVRGEGRYCFVAMQPRKTPEDEPQGHSPYIILAWPLAANTSVEERFYEITRTPSEFAPGNATSAARGTASGAASSFTPPTMSASEISRMRQRHVNGALRAVTMGEFPPTHGTPDVHRMKRTTLEFRKAGGIPIVEAYRMDIQIWEEWRLAVGAGRARIVMTRLAPRA